MVACAANTTLGATRGGAYIERATLEGTSGLCRRVDGALALYTTSFYFHSDIMTDDGSMMMTSSQWCASSVIVTMAVTMAVTQ